ncbi:MAG TPA: hypothetical protein VFV95_04955 [Vicinamibacterales bacterium]|nr:hypothetical protein [Vicinamibacterales bacterium]
MRALVRALQFFGVVPPLPSLMVYSFVFVTVAAIVSLSVDVHRAPTAIIPTLVLQVFATSTGFTAHARRGYYDVLLTEGVGRLRTALTHWLMSSAPGLVSWLIVAATERMIAGTTTAVAPGSITALVASSTIPWGTTVALPRFSGAIGWMLLCVMTITLAPRGMAFGSNESLTATGWPAAVEALVFPVRLVGGDVGHVAVLALPLLASAASMMSALLWIARTPLPLEAAQ